MSLDKALCIVLAAAFMAGLYFTPPQTDYNPPHTWPQLASAFVVAVCIMVLGFRALERKERERDQLYAELGGAGPDFGPHPYARRRHSNLLHAAALSSAVPDATTGSMSTSSNHDRTSDGVPIRTPCCDRMRADLAHVCNVHQDRFDCPDALVAEIRGGYGLMVHDGGRSVIEIAFCPWCGEKLPGIGEPPPAIEEDADDPDGIEMAGRDSGC